MRQCWLCKVENCDIPENFNEKKNWPALTGSNFNKLSRVGVEVALIDSYSDSWLVATTPGDSDSDSDIDSDSAPRTTPLSSMLSGL